MPTIKYFNPKTNKYFASSVKSIDGDKVECTQKQGQYTNNYTESLTRLREGTTAPNPDWHGKEPKPLVILINFPQTNP